jgi:hypothetical protein
MDSRRYQTSAVQSFDFGGQYYGDAGGMPVQPASEVVPCQPQPSILASGSTSQGPWQRPQINAMAPIQVPVPVAQGTGPGRHDGKPVGGSAQSFQQPPPPFRASAVIMHPISRPHAGVVSQGAVVRVLGSFLLKVVLHVGA